MGVWVSVCMITYNHEKFITEAIEGVLMQETVFEYELVIANDNSFDNTDKIIQEFITIHPKGHRIRYFKQEKNIGMMPNALFALAQSKGKFIALCEGDDYWIDKNKLQKQVDFLEQNPDFSICFHDVYTLFENSNKKEYTANTEREILTIEDLAKWNFINTPSCVFKNQIIEFPSWFKDCPAGDYALHLLNAQYGKIKRIPEAMAVYRVHDGGVWSMKDRMYILSKWIPMVEKLKHQFNSNLVICFEEHLTPIYHEYIELLSTNFDTQIVGNEVLEVSISSEYFVENIKKLKLNHLKQLEEVQIKLILTKNYIKKNKLKSIIKIIIGRDLI